MIIQHQGQMSKTDKYFRLYVSFPSDTLPSGLVAQYPRSYTSHLSTPQLLSFSVRLTALLFAFLASFGSASQGDYFDAFKMRS